MNKNRLITFVTIFIHFFIFLFSFPSFSFSQTSQDALRPCLNDLMGMDILNEYNDLLRKHLFTEIDVAEPGNLVRLIVNPSFEKEEYIVIYKTNEGLYRLELTQPSDSIWYSMQYDETPEKYRDGSISKIEDIKMKISRKTISKELTKAISKVWWEMIRTQKFPPNNEFNILDGTMYWFSSGLGVCGMSIGWEGENVKALIQIGKELKEYAQQEGSSQETEDNIMQLSNQLYKKLQPHQQLQLTPKGRRN